MKRTDATSERHQRAEIYRRAALLVERGKVRDPGKGSCSAIAEAKHPRMSTLDAYDAEFGKPILRIYSALFKPECSGCYWGEWWGQE